MQFNGAMFQNQHVSAAFFPNSISCRIVKSILFILKFLSIASALTNLALNHPRVIKPVLNSAQLDVVTSVVDRMDSFAEQSPAKQVCFSSRSEHHIALYQSCFSGI